MADIRIVSLPLATGGTAATPSDVVAIDGATTRKAPLSALADVIRPVATQADAETGTNNVKTMTPLTTAQAIAFQAASANQGAKADTALQPSDIGTTVASAAEGDLAVTALQPESTIFVPSNLTSSVQAPAIIKANGYRWSLFAFNGGEIERAKATNIADYRSVIEVALLTGEKVEFPYWEYPLRSATDTTVNNARVVSITADIPIDVDMTSGSRVIFGPELDGLVGGALSLRASTMPSMSSQIPFRWAGGFLDGSLLAQQTATGLTLLDIYQYTGGSVEGVKFYSGTSTPSGASIGFGRVDGAITTHNCFGTVINNCDFIGFVDQGVYLSGNNDAGAYDGIGEAEVVQNCRFRRCTNGINNKRDHVGMHAINNYFFECGNNILASPTDGSTTNHGETSIIIGNRMRKTQGRPIYLETGKDYQIKDNVIVDFGKWISDGSTFTSVSSGNRIAGIDGRSVSFALIAGNMIRQESFQGGTASANQEPVGIQLQAGDDAVGSFDNIVKDNNVYKVQRTYLDVSGGGRNKWIDNDYTLATSGTSLAHAIQPATSQWVGPIIEGSATVDPPSIAAGTTYALAVTVTGAALGDWVDSVSLSRDISNITYSANITAADTVTVRLFNGTAAAIDIANTIFRVRVRKS